MGHIEKLGKQGGTDIYVLSEDEFAAWEAASTDPIVVENGFEAWYSSHYGRPYGTLGVRADPPIFDLSRKRALAMLNPDSNGTRLVTPKDVQAALNEVYACLEILAQGRIVNG